MRLTYIECVCGIPSKIVEITFRWKKWSDLFWSNANNTIRHNESKDFHKKNCRRQDMLLPDTDVSG